MKKGVLLLVGIFTTILISGCKEKTEKITCILKGDEYNGITEVRNAIGEFKENKITKLTSEIITTYDNENKKSIKETADILKPTINKFNDYDGVKASIKTSDKTLTITISINLSKTAEKDLDKLNVGISNAGVTKEEYKKELEDKGYMCK